MHQVHILGDGLRQVGGIEADVQVVSLMVALDHGHLRLGYPRFRVPGAHGDHAVDAQLEPLIAGQAGDADHGLVEQRGLGLDVDGLVVHRRDDLFVGWEGQVREVGIELPGAALDAQDVAGPGQDGLVSVLQHARERGRSGGG